MTYPLKDIKEIAEYQIALILVKTNDALCKRSIDPEGLPSRRGMDADHRMDSFDVFRAGVWVISIEISMRGLVDSFATVDDLAESGRELLVCRVAAGPERVAADLGDGVVVEVCDACRLGCKRMCQ